MASVEVFVDDAVRGRLPNVCAKSGRAAEGRLRVVQPYGGLGAGWLFVFVPGMWWVALLLWAVTGRRRLLTVRLPYSREALAFEQRLARRRLGAVAIGASAAVAAYVFRSSGALVVPFVVVAAVALGAALLMHVAIGWAQVRVRLDASGRWVTLSNVHPWFATAVHAQPTDEHTDQF
jgi:hypothetical protein